MKKKNLFCIPYAGGSSIIYNSWHKFLDINFELFPVELAGRGKRYKTPLYLTFDQAVNDIFTIIEEQITNLPYAIFGHSMGGLIAYELYFKIIEEGYNPPSHIFLSAIKPPHLKNKNISDLSDEKFKEEIMNFSNIQKKILKNQVLSDILLPILKADFKVFENYSFNNSRNKLDCPITVFFAENDLITDEEILQWSDYTNLNFNMYNFSDDHFFINKEENSNRIIELINSNMLKV
ncbi:MAG: thioesterase domain-containing protein [Cyanobacteriota bacterium]